MKKLSLKDYRYLLLLALVSNPGEEGLRRGQRLMNALHEVRPDMYESITGTNADIFYNHSREKQLKFFVTICGPEAIESFYKKQYNIIK
jgi:hypothetical protein